jgi:hypothetical protein
MIKKHAQHKPNMQSDMHHTKKTTNSKKASNHPRQQSKNPFWKHATKDQIPKMGNYQDAIGHASHKENIKHQKSIWSS